MTLAAAAAAHRRRPRRRERRRAAGQGTLPAGPADHPRLRHGEARAEPDQATLEFGVETQAATAQQAAAENAGGWTR
jgi:hypothetical protein